MDEVVMSDRVIFGDYLIPGADPRVYTQVTDMSRLVKVMSLPQLLSISKTR